MGHYHKRKRKLDSKKSKLTRQRQSKAERENEGQGRKLRDRPNEDRLFMGRFWKKVQALVQYTHVQWAELKIILMKCQKMPLLTSETQANGDLWSTNDWNERGSFLVGSLGLSCQYKRFLFSTGCSSRPSTKYIFFLTVHYFNSFVPIACWAGSRAGSLVSECVSLVPPTMQCHLINF